VQTLVNTKQVSHTRVGTIEDSDPGLPERLFYSDCDPKQALERAERATQVAKLINSFSSFTPLRVQDTIREAFQSEVELSSNLIEASAKMNKLIALVNFRLKSHLKLGPNGLVINERLYLVNDDAPTQSLNLNLRFLQCGKRLGQQPESFDSAA